LASTALLVGIQNARLVETGEKKEQVKKEPSLNSGLPQNKSTERGHSLLHSDRAEGGVGAQNAVLDPQSDVVAILQFQKTAGGQALP
jgi:hypothetical protein